ncbi:MAG: twin transmembrane helix small protein [Alphaproteobacteria bacterium]
MSAVFPIVIGIVLAAVVVVLFVGIIAMSRGGEFNAKWGNKLMRYRVGLQATAIVLLLLFWWTTRG